jgi:hypothetical protein
MRTKTALLTAAVLAAGVLASVAQNVYSVNVVGYVNKTLLGDGKFTLLANPLSGATNTLDGILKGALPTNAKVLKWNGTSFTTYQRTAAGWLPPTAGSVTLNPGEGFFVQLPAGSSDTNVTFVGEVLQGNLVNSYSDLYNLTGNKFADSGTLTSLGFTNIPPNDKVLLWNSTAQSYTTFTKTASGWLPPAGPSIDVGDGFFVNTPAGTFDWTRDVSVQ